MRDDWVIGLLFAFVVALYVVMVVTDRKTAKLPDKNPDEHFHIETWNGHDWVVYRKVKTTYANDFGLAHSPDCKCMKGYANEKREP